MEYMHERFILNKIGEFRNSKVEADFKEYEKASIFTITRFLILVMGFTFAIFAVSDYFFYSEEGAFPLSIGLRGAVLFISIIVFFMAEKIKNYSHTLLMITFLELFVFAIFLSILYMLNIYDSAQHFMSVMLFILAAFLIPNSWKNSLIAAFIIWLGYIIFCVALQGAVLYDPTDSPTLLQRGIYLGICLNSCAIFIYGREKSERKHYAAEQFMEFVSITDKLTGVFNRNRFEYILGRWIKSKRHDPFCLLFFDIDNFKMVNDQYGHNIGDQVLVETANAISASIRDNDIFARWGGEEFVLLFDKVHIELGSELAERLRRAVEMHPCGKAGKVTVSIGVAEYRREEEESIPNFINRADEKMYEAKKAGKNRVAL